MFDRARAAVRANRPPASVRAVVPPGEHLLGWALDSGGEPLAATESGLHAYGDRLAWTEIDHVTLTGPTLVIRAIDGEAREVVLGDPRDLPAVVKARVEASILHSRHVPLLSDGRGVRVVARRSGAAIDWRLHYDPGVLGGGDDAEARAAASLASIRAELGA